MHLATPAESGCRGYWCACLMGLDRQPALLKSNQRGTPGPTKAGLAFSGRNPVKDVRV
jgi:hypothetical protein